MVVVVVAVLAAAGVTWLVVRDDDRSRFSEAVGLAPESTIRFSWTDWAGIRRVLGDPLTTTSSESELDAFLLKAFDRDLGSASALEESAPTIHTALGFSPASVDWELFAQGEDGAVVILKMPESYDFDALRDRLRAVGFPEPDEEDGVWAGGVDLLEGLDGPVTPELAAIQVDEDEGLIVGSDDPRYLADRADNERGDGDDGLAEVVAATGPALSAVAYTGDRACSELSMSGADPADRNRAAELVEQAGDVHPVSGFAMAVQPGSDVLVALAFETDDQARTNADSRSKLAAGPAPGQGGTFPDRFTLGKVVADGHLLTMRLTPTDGSFVFSDLNHGPVLFATC